MEEGTIFKLWKDEDHQATTEETPEAAPEVAAEEEIPAEQPAEATEAEPETQTEEPPKQEEAPQSQIDIEQEIQARLGRPSSDIQKELDRLAKLERLAVEDEELIPDDDFLKDFTRAYKRGGKQVAEGYIEALTRDFTKFTPEQLVEYSVQKRMPGAPKFAVEQELKKELSAMGWNEDLEPGTPEYQRFSEYLAWKAGELKEKFITEQKSFKIPERQQPQQQAQEAGVDEEAMKRYEQSLRQSPETIGLMAAKAVKFGDFTLAVEPEKVVAQALDTVEFFKHFQKQNGELDFQKFYEIAAIAEIGPKKFYEMATADAAAKERLKWIKETKNPSSDPKPIADKAAFTVKMM